MNKIVGFPIVLMMGSLAFAHDVTDWRQDASAFQYHQIHRTDPILKIQPQPVPEFQIDAVFLKSKLEELTGVVPTMINGAEVRIQERKSVAGRDLTRAFLTRD